MDIQEAYAYITERNQLGCVLGLEHMQELMRRLGEPQNQCNVVHIAGTNGKGSILAYMDAALQDAGYRVGRYISPTVFCYLERFQINDAYMPEPVFAEILSRVKSVVAEMEAEGICGITAFEIETAVAFLYFFEQKTDIVLVETGLGGRLDATNIVERPVCTILASIRLDHMNLLGDTIPAIAYEKTGILRDGVPCIAYPDNPEAMPIIQEQCRLHNAELIVPDLVKLSIKSQDLQQEIFDYKNVKYHSALLGEYQIYNAITAIEALFAVKKALKIDLNIVNIQNGLHNIDWRGRFEIMERSPYVIRDGAHNLDAAKGLYQQITKHFTNCRILYIIGVLRDKQYREMLSLLAPLAWKIYAVTVPENPRALPAERLAEEAGRYCPQVTTADSPEQAYRLAKQEAEPEDVILAFGSLYYIGRIGD